MHFKRLYLWSSTIKFIQLLLLHVTRLCVGYNEFEYMQCGYYSGCVPYNRSRYTNDIYTCTSRWPKGPYALLSSIVGCPESPDVGWRRGYISFTWKHPHEAVSERGCGFYTSDEKCKQALLPELWPFIESYMSGPFSKYAFTFNFCFKNDKVYTGSDEAQWPNGSYIIFGDKSGCPSGFRTSNLTIRLPQIYSWKSYGKLPAFNVVSGDEGRLFFKTCIHEDQKESLNSNVNDTSSNNNIEINTFILIQANASRCPQITNMNITVENLKLIEDRTVGKGEIDIFTICYYQQIEEPAPIRRYYFWFREDQIRSVKDFTIVFGNSTTSGKLTQNAYPYAIPRQNHIIPWIVIDAGRSIIATGIGTPSKMNSNYLDRLISRCFIGDNRWMMTHFGADECLFIRRKDYWRYMYIEFIKQYNGRFIKLTGYPTESDEHFNTMKYLHIFNIPTVPKVINDDGICNEDLGMADGTITDSQIQNASSSRPFQRGWCSDSNLTYPFLTVNLSDGMRVEGITIFNMQRVQEKIEDGKFRRQILLAGVKKILLSFFTTLQNQTYVQQNKTFRIDEYFPIDRPQTFFFDVPGKVTLIEIYILDSFEETCIRFELHGCRGPGLDKASLPRLGLLPYDDVIINNVQTITAISTNTSIQPSIGYQGTYPAGSSFMWIIRVPDSRYISLLFTTITHNVYFDGSCSDNLKTTWITAFGKLNERLIFDGIWKLSTAVTINTAGSVLNLTLFSCTPLFKIQTLNQGIKAIVRAKDIPTCFLTRPDSQKKIKNRCKDPMMILSSYSHLSLLDATVPERWKIQVHKSFIHLQFIYINVRCDTGSSLKIKDKYGTSKSFCNLRNVQPELFSDSKFVKITFKKGDTSKTRNARTSATEWFKANYTAMRLVQEKHKCSIRFGKCYFINYGVPLSWKVARSKCFNMGRRLVTIHSAEEHELIKNMLRYYIHIHTYTAFKRWREDPGDYTHIGLSGVTKENGKHVQIWEDGSPVTFSAWGENEPSLMAECTRMSFHLFNTNNTWESESCSFRLARLFVCERKTNTEFRDPYSTVNNYTGLWNQTKSERTCQKWNSQVPHKHEQFQDSQFPDGSVEDASNYCRDPSNKGFLWCFTTDPAVIYEQCVFNYTFGNPYDRSLFSESNETVHCGNGDFISSDMVCDGVPNCFIAKDETNCTDKVHPLLQNVNYSSENSSIFEIKYSMIQCRQGREWISQLSQCDGVVDCVDASDEINCSKSTLKCSSNENKCGSGECIHISQMCDFIEDCVDASDEMCDYPLCSTSEFMCQNKQCIPDENRCNAFENCLDGSDEDGCVTCKNSTHHCDAQRCIARRFVCDNYPDCQDKSDERSCKQPLRFSCEEWWSAGYRTSGVYKLNETDVRCKFTSVPEGRIISTEFYNFEVTRTTDPYKEVIHSTNNATVKGLEASFFKNDSYSCEQTIKQTCTPDFIAAFETKELSSIDAYKVCKNCAIMKINLSQFDGNYSETYFCDRDEPITESNITMYFTYQQSEDYMPNVTLLPNVFNESMQLEFGPMICRNKMVIEETDFSCDDGHVIPLSIRCVYDTDPAGFIVGCRSGKHLQGCENVTCPENTAKCPGSFCIPTRFICDGQIHCPGGHDEEECGCKSNELEVILLHKEETEKRDIFYDIGRQFFSSTSIVRELIYRERQKTLKQGNEHIHLDITDTKIDPFSVIKRKHASNYTILASKFVKNITFSMAGTRGLIFFDRNDTTTLSNVFTNVHTNPGFLIYRIQHNSTVDAVDSSFMRTVTVAKWSTLATLAAKYFPALCKEAAKTSCPNQYKCATSKTCIPLHQVCDGFAQCRYGDDERFCSYTCPENCSCLEYSTDCSNRGIEESIVASLDIKSRSIDLSRNPGLQNSFNSTTWLFPYLIVLNLSNCNIHGMKPYIFKSLVNLRFLDLSFNELKQIPGYAFSGLQRLQELNLHGNRKILDFDSRSLTGLNGLNSLEIRNVTIGTLSAYTFYELNLETLTFSHNSIKEIKDGAFETLKVRKVDIMKNKISGFGKKLFKGMHNLELLHTPEFKFCCVKPDYLLENKCFPTKDEFSSCEDLIRHPALQMMLWFIGIIALLGNVLSIVYRLVYDRQQLKFGYGIFVTNLAVADFFMGVYLLIIAIADAVYKKRYIFEDASWRSSTWCTFAGFLSTISSEASVFFLCLITIDRLFVIKFPFGQVRFDSKKAYIACGLSWTIALLIGIIPIIDYSHFKSQFYSKSGVCIALPLTKDDRLPGWWYSFFVFVGLNFVTFCFIAFGQIAIYIEMKRSTSGISKSQYSHDKQGARRRMELTVARNLFFIVATDFLCWFPIGCMGIMSSMGQTIPGEVYAWTAVFVLPVNSALNPILYTLTAIIGKKQKKPKELSPVYISAKQVRPFNGMFRYFMNYRSPDCFISLDELIQGTIPVTPTDAAKIALKLTRCLCVLHKNSIVVKKLNKHAVYISVERGKVIGDVQLRQEPVICSSKEEKADDIYQLALIIRILLPRKRQVTSL